MGSEITQACFFLGLLAEKMRDRDEEVEQIIEMIFNLLTHGAETQLKAALGAE